MFYSFQSILVVSIRRHHQGFIISRVFLFVLRDRLYSSLFFDNTLDIETSTLSKNMFVSSNDMYVVNLVQNKLSELSNFTLFVHRQHAVYFI